MANNKNQFQIPSGDFRTVSFENHKILTLVTDTPTFVDAWIADIQHFHRRRLHRLLVGLDVEWHPNRSRNEQNPVAIIQLCVGQRCLVFQILKAGPFIPQSLKDFLGNPSYTFTGVGVDEDAEKLKADHNLRVAKTTDLRWLAAEKFGDHELKRAGLKKLASNVLKVQMEKPKHIATSAWDADYLSPQQVRYACLDAFASFEIAKVLLGEEKKSKGIRAVYKLHADTSSPGLPRPPLKVNFKKSLRITDKPQSFPPHTHVNVSGVPNVSRYGFRSFSLLFA